MGFSTSTCTEFVEVLSSKAPVPGGGGASALVGAVGTALGNMVGSLTVGKKNQIDPNISIDEYVCKLIGINAAECEVIGNIYDNQELVAVN